MYAYFLVNYLRPFRCKARLTRVCLRVPKNPFAVLIHRLI